MPSNNFFIYKKTFIFANSLKFILLNMCFYLFICRGKYTCTHTFFPIPDDTK